MNARLLLVDDERLILECFTAILTRAGFEVQTASSAHEGVTALQQGAFDLVITDIAMETPAAGYDVIRAASQQPSRPDIVILTAFPIPTAEWKAMGVKALFLKAGQGPNALVEAIKTIRAHSLREKNARNTNHPVSGNNFLRT